MLVRWFALYNNLNSKNKMTVNATIVDTQFKFSGAHEVSDVFYSGGRLSVVLKDLKGKEAIIATFTEVAGFRVLDEGDLLEFWPMYSSQSEWLFCILSNGWLEQEKMRKGFVRGDVERLCEYLITGSDDCVSVLAWDLPEVNRRDT
jgi:hypothetical protein